MSEVLKLEPIKKLEPVEDVKPEDKPLTFEQVMQKNKETQERLRQERLKANNNVLKSYKIKS